jgi:hypothetical protein
MISIIALDKHVSLMVCLLNSTILQFSRILNANVRYVCDILTFLSHGSIALVGLGLLCEDSRSHSSQGPLLDNTQHSPQTGIHTPGGIRTRNPGRRAAIDPLPRTRGR